jgi:hypothetical protein
MRPIMPIRSTRPIRLTRPIRPKISNRLLKLHDVTDLGVIDLGATKPNKKKKAQPNNKPTSMSLAPSNMISSNMPSTFP